MAQAQATDLDTELDTQMSVTLTCNPQASSYLLCGLKEKVMNTIIVCGQIKTVQVLEARESVKIKFLLQPMQSVLVAVKVSE